MAVAVENALTTPYRVIGAQKKTVTNVTCSEKYVEKGEALTPAQLGLNVVEDSSCRIKSLGTGTVNFANAFYDAKEKKLILRDETPAEVASEAEIKKPVIQVEAYGN